MKQAKFLRFDKLFSALLMSACAGYITPAIVGANAHAFAAASAPAGLPDFANLVEKSGPAVVNIRTSEKAQAGQPDDSAQDEQMQELLRRFFGAPAPRQAPAPTPKGKRAPQPSDDGTVQRGVGSGFIISQDGYVMTNAHVVSGADEVYVKLSDAREFKARVVGLDARTDVAILKIDGNKLPIATIGKSANTRVGEWVIAIGSPFDLDNTVTAGIISAKARETGDFLPLIQTDVAVNPGNSGGPLINMRGEVVGINSQIYSRSGGYMGISFAIPIDEAMRVADQLKATGHVTRGRLGVYLGDVSRELADTLGWPKAQGGLVGRIEKGGPADKAGLLGGDIILKFNGAAVEKSADLRRMAAATRPGAEVKLGIWRKGAAQEISLTLAELEQEVARADVEAPDQTENALGLVINDLTTAQKNTLGIATGILIKNADGVAERAGLRTGDIILTINNLDVKSAKQFSALLAKTDPKKPVLLLARREETSQFFTLRRSAQ
jgi:serine protease Do